MSGKLNVTGTCPDSSLQAHQMPGSIAHANILPTKSARKCPPTPLSASCDSIYPKVNVLLVLTVSLVSVLLFTPWSWAPWVDSSSQVPEGVKSSTQQCIRRTRQARAPQNLIH